MGEGLAILLKMASNGTSENLVSVEIDRVNTQKGIRWCTNIGEFYIGNVIFVTKH